MDRAKIKQFVESVAEIKELKPTTSPDIRLDDTHQNDVRVGDDWVHINKDQNPTLGFKFVKYKDNYRACELGCGEIVNNQVIEKRLNTHPELHWRTRCNNCGCFVGPDGVELIKGGHQVQSAFIRYFRSKK